MLKRNPCRRLSLCAAAVYIVLLLTGTSAAAEAYLLIEEAEGIQQQSSAAQTELPRGFPVSHRFRRVQLSPAVMARNIIEPGDTLFLNLFDDTAYEAVIDTISVNINGAVMMRGRLQGYPYASVTLSRTQGRLLASVYIPEIESHYIIQSNVPGDHYVMDLDIASVDKLNDITMEIPEDTAAASQSQQQGYLQPQAAPLDPVTVDVMILYTPAAATWASTSGGGIENVIAQAMQKAQTALDNSNTYLTFRLVHSAQVSYTESGTMETDLDRLTNASDGYIDQAHTLRDQYGADLVTLLTDADDYGGLAWLLNSSAGNPDYGFSIHRVQQISWTYTSVHEWGHNMGCGHHKDQGDPDPGLFSYSAGWRWTGSNSGNYHSVMAYDDGDIEVGYFSNPNVFYLDAATGDAVDGDNARTLRETKDVVAAYRAEVITSDPVPPVAENENVTVTEPNGVVIELPATDDGLPEDPGKLSYIITSLPEHGWLFDPNDGLEIISTPYTLQNDGNSVIYEPCPYYFQGTDGFTFKANDGGTAPDGGDSNIADVNLVMNMLSDVLYEIDTIYKDYIPFMTGFKKVRSQALYHASELGGTGMTISSLALKIQTPPAIEIQNLMIRMKHAALDEYSTTAQFDNDGWTVVYDANETITEQDDWHEFVFDKPFTYDGANNLLIDFSFDNTSTSSGYGYVYDSATGTQYRIISYWSNSGNPLEFVSPNYKWKRLFNLTLKTQPDTETLRADFNYNCSVGTEDLMTMVDAWLSQQGDTGYNSACDISVVADNKVDIADFAVLASEWLNTIE